MRCSNKPAVLDAEVPVSHGSIARAPPAGPPRAFQATAHRIPLTVEFDGGEQRRYRTGDVIVEAVGTWHFGANMGAVPVRLLVIDQVEAGQPPTILAK